MPPWTTFQWVQENLIRGRVRPLDKRSPTRAIQGIDGDLKLNRALRLFLCLLSSGDIY
ncbi:DUF945 domain-containing protein [Salmonella enterica subsp. diarizonae]|nr:DUF945 domain-containing protein [Salmonella enterica subsp. diarizonae]ELI2366677.1 hypothetical protein [Salmonella enterica]